MKKPKYRYLKTGERTRRSDIVKHSCGCYYYERAGVVYPHLVDEYCGKCHCYRRIHSQRVKPGKVK